MNGPVGWWCLQCEGFFRQFSKHQGHPWMLKNRKFGTYGTGKTGPKRKLSSNGSLAQR